MHYPIKALERYATFPVVLMIYILVGCLALYRPDFVSTYIQSFFCVSTLFGVLLFSWLGKRLRFGRKPPVFKGIYWCMMLWAGLMGFIFIAQLIQVVLSNFNPYVAALYISNEAYLEATLSLIQFDSLTYWGYFSALSCWVMGLSYVYYHQNGVPCAHRIAACLVERYFRHRKWAIWFKSFGEGHVYLAQMLWLGLATLCTVVLLSSGLLKLSGLPSYFTIPIISMSFFSVLFLIFGSRFFKKNIERLSRYQLSLSTITLVLIGFMIAVLFLASKGIQYILAHDPSLLKLVECDCTINILKLFIASRMQNLGWALWVLTLPMMATFVVRISLGRRLIEIILGIFSFALLIQIVGYFYNQTAWLNLLSSIQGPVPQIFLGLGLLFFLAIIFYKKQNSWIFSNGLMPGLPRKSETGESIYPVSEISLFHGTKIKGLGMVTRKWIIMCLGLLVAHTVGGWQVIQIELTVMSVILVFLYFFALIGMWIEWRQVP